MLGPKQPKRSPGWSRVSSPRPHLASECLSAPSKEEGWSGQQHCGAGVTWVVEAGLAVHPTRATPDPGGSLLFSGQWDALCLSFFFFFKKNMERFTNLRVILVQGPC